MKAFLLAGGRGERLRPVTLTCPKCLVRINGVPLLETWLDRFACEGVDDVLLNVSHHAGLVREFLARRSRPPHVELIVEDEPCGTAGTVSAHRGFVDGEKDFWIVYADNLTDVSLRAMLATHRRHEPPVTIGLFHAPNPSAAGIVQMLPDGRIVSFEEKPKQPRSDLANAGIYVAGADLLAELPPAGRCVIDFGYDILPRFAGRMFGHVIDGFFLDIGTPAALARASSAWAARSARAGP